MSFPIYLKNGERVNINDHVYCSPSWSVRDGTPYSVARIMEFLGPEGSPRGDEGKLYHKTRVRLAWYYRPCDVSDRPVADSRLLLAAIYSEVCDINQLRAKCHVVHRDKITDLAGWKKRPDRFYFNRLFDPYIKKEFEILQSTDVRNLPDNIRENLISRYEYVVAEKEVIPDLTDTVRLCDTCKAWCPNPETVQCDRCKKFFHMGCVQPPLLAKPSRGYGWTCAPCSRRHEEEVDSHEVRHTTPVITKPKSNAPAPRGRGRPRKDRTLAEKEENFPVKYYQSWPFRYFGQYTFADDTLDPDDLIFARSATRIGTKYQVNIASAPGMDALPPDVEERGGDDTVEVLSQVNTLYEEPERYHREIAELESHLYSLAEDLETRTNVDWLTEVVHRFSEILFKFSLTVVNMRTLTRQEKWKRQETKCIDRSWISDEIALFEAAIIAHGAELRTVRDNVITRSLPEVVRFYGHWKNAKLGEEHARLRQLGSPPKPVWRQWDSIMQAIEGQRVGLSDDEKSTVDELEGTSHICGACRTRESKKWWKAPKGLATDVLCDSCGLSWRKYADLNVRPLREEPAPSGKAKLAEKREGTPLTAVNAKRARTSASSHSTPPPTFSNAPSVRCLACLCDGPLGKVVRCRQCHFRAHAGACGEVVDPSSVESWRCPVCENEDLLEASLNYDCLLCPRVPKEARKLTQRQTFLHARKPTEGQGWAHVLCAVFMPEITFGDAARLRAVEGISIIPLHRWTTPCCLCGEPRGAVVRCSDCVKEFHVSCAWKHDYKIGFEIQPVKSSRRDSTTVTTFNGETGCFTPIISCFSHDNRRHVYGLCDVNEMGETALQVYCRVYKQAPLNQGHALLRKARRLDQVMGVRSDYTPSHNSDTPKEHCHQCNTTYSPYFHPLPRTAGSTTEQEAWLCHRCYFESQKPSSQAGIAIS